MSNRFTHEDYEAKITFLTSVRDWLNELAGFPKEQARKNTRWLKWVETRLPYLRRKADEN